MGEKVPLPEQGFTTLAAMVKRYEVEMTLFTVINGGSTCRMNDRWSNEQARESQCEV